jgi:TrpR family trp operon transcriptional repressor
MITGGGVKKDKSWRKFVLLTKKMAKEDAVFEEYWQLMLTPEERAQLAKRVLIVEALLLGEQSQRDIAKAHCMSISKITRGSNQLKQHSPGFLAKVLRYVQSLT